ARLHRVEGLSAADQDEPDTAIRHLDAAWGIFLAADNQAGMAIIEFDRLGLDVRDGHEPAVSDVLSGTPPRTVSEYRLRAMALRRQLRYEEAFEVLLRGVADHDLDPALRWPVLYDLIVLLRLIRQDGVAERLIPLLAEAAVVSADPAAVAAAVARLSADAVPSDAVSLQFDRRVQHARRLIIGRRLDKAESLLTELLSQARTGCDTATWHLGAGELELARYELDGDLCFVRDAAGHLSKAAEYSSTTALVEIRACALGLLGDACELRGADERAVECWSLAHHLEEQIASNQITDDVRIAMLQAVPDEHDKRIEAAARRLRNRITDAAGETAVTEATAAVVVALEAARGATILARILPGATGLARDLPRPNDLRGAWRWVTDITHDLPRSQVVWIMHATPDRVHHAIVGHELLYHTSVLSPRNQLMNAITQLTDCTRTEEILEENIANHQFDTCLDVIAAQIGIDAVIPILKLPSQVRRIAIVAGDALSDIPFAAMRVPGGTEPLGTRFALSDLPCLSAQLPLHRRAHQSRGDRLLEVSPPAGGITRAAGRRPHTPLDGDRATLARLEAELKRHHHHQVRIDCHGQHEFGEPSRSWLQLAPEGISGRLRPEDLQWMDLKGCGTLVLGACESGMAQRKGRDERIGFVRAAVHAGAPAVIAARWRAADAVAATVLDRFGRYVRYLPRDLALQRAQLDVCRGAPDILADIPAVAHPARWACWTLYGDSGWQTRAGLFRRALRRGLDQGRRYAARS
ncbi:MAG: CHAT domain-containing protein, partial [Pseudonocardiaceae bacterium]